MISLSLDEIQKNSANFDAENIHLKIKQDVESGQFSFYIEALLNYIEENDIEIEPENVKTYITPTLLGILEREAKSRGLMRDKSLSKLIDEFF